jgi:predicted nucleic acid-binding protein
VADRPRVARGLLDTSVVIDLEHIAADRLPLESAVSALTFAELAAGPHATGDANERARRQERLQRLEAATSPIPFGANAARAYGRVFAAVAAAGRKPRGGRAVDLMIAATALAEGLPLFTRNLDDFAELDDLIQVIAV